MTENSEVSVTETPLKACLLSIRYSAQVFIPLDNETMAAVHGNKERLSQVAEEFLFKQIEENPGNTIFLLKANPLFRLTIRFANEGVFLKAETDKPDILKYFKRLVSGELSAILSSIRTTSRNDVECHYVV